MLIATVVAAVAAWAPAQPVPVDTVFAAERGARLSVEVRNGRVAVDSWDRDAVRLRPEGGGDADVSRLGSVIRVRPRAGRAAAADAVYRLTVPRWMDVRIEGSQVDVTVREAGGEVAIETVGGGVTVDGGAGRVSIRTIQGGVVVRNARGLVEVVTVNEGVLVEDVTGDLSVQTTNGGITLRRIRSANVRATTVNGSVHYEGTIAGNGRYALSTHNGRVGMTIPGDANATVTVATFHGDFYSDFPVRLTGASRDRHYHFTLGTGSARVELESFNGEIRLTRPR